MIDLIRADELSRLSSQQPTAAASTSYSTSRVNRSRRYCSTTCVNRNAVAAYRARRAQRLELDGGPAPRVAPLVRASQDESVRVHAGPEGRHRSPSRCEPVAVRLHARVLPSALARWRGRA